MVGDPEAVAQELARLHSAGLDGLAVNFVDYLAEVFGFLVPAEFVLAAAIAWWRAG